MFGTIFKDGLFQLKTYHESLKYEDVHIQMNTEIKPICK